MPRYPLEDYFSDKEFAELVRKLNALTHPAFQWRWTRARKEHEDIFGETIHRREEYFKREVGVAWGNDIKVSRISMERIVPIGD
jgi:hypothetical protein